MNAMIGDLGVSDDSIHAEEFTGFDLNKIGTNGTGKVAGYGWRRAIPMVATVLAVTALVILHAGAAVSIFRNGLGGASGVSPIWFVTIPVLLVLAIFKIRYFVGRHLTRRRLLGHAFGGRGTHVSPSDARKHGRQQP